MNMHWKLIFKLKTTSDVTHTHLEMKVMNYPKTKCNAVYNACLWFFMNISDLDIKLELKYYPIWEKLFSQEKYWDNLL